MREPALALGGRHTLRQQAFGSKVVPQCPRDGVLEVDHGVVEVCHRAHASHDRDHLWVAEDELQRCCPSGFDPKCVEALGAALDLPALQEAFECA